MIIREITPFEGEYLPVSQSVHIASAADFPPDGPYLPAAQGKPEHKYTPPSYPSKLYVPGTQNDTGLGHDVRSFSQTPLTHVASHTNVPEASLLQ